MAKQPPKQYISNSEADEMRYLAACAQDAFDRWLKAKNELDNLRDKVRLLEWTGYDAPLVANVKKLDLNLEYSISQLHMKVHAAAMEERNALRRIKEMLVKLVPPPVYKEEEEQIAARVAAADTTAEAVPF